MNAPVQTPLLSMAIVPKTPDDRKKLNARTTRSIDSKSKRLQAKHLISLIVDLVDEEI